MKMPFLKTVGVIFMGLCLGSGEARADETRKQLLSDPTLLMFISFDESADADINAGSVSCTTTGESEIVDGVVGKARSLMKEQDEAPLLSYEVQKSFNVEQGTLMFWFQPGWIGEDLTGKYSLVWISMQNSEHYFTLHRSFDADNPRTLFANFHWDNSLQLPTQGHFFPHQWMHIAITWDQAKAQYALYVDGKLVIEAPWKPIPDVGQYRPTWMHLGRFYNDDTPINSTYDEFYIFERSLSPSEIHNYVKELVP